MLHALKPSAAHRYDITDLEAGTAIYARVSGHTLMSYGYTALSDPEYETPSNVQPGAPAAVRLWASSDSSITVHWDHPTVDGGTKYGYSCGCVPLLNTSVLASGENTFFCYDQPPFVENQRECAERRKQCCHTYSGSRGHCYEPRAGSSYGASLACVCALISVYYCTS